MKLRELKSYVNENGRTRAQHERVARIIGISPDAKGNLLLHNINRRIESRIKSEGPEAISGFTPPNNRSTNGNHLPQRQRGVLRYQNPPNRPLVPPAQTPPPTGLGGNFLTNGGIWQLLVAAAAVAVIVVLAFWAIHELTDDDGESSISASPDATPVVSPTATATSSAGGDSGNPPNGGQPDTDNPQDAHYKRLEELDRVYDPNQDYVAWLTAAGVTWDRLLKKDAREVETEYNPATKHNLAAAIQVEGTGIVVSWPNIVTTHVPSWIVQNEASRSYQPDASDPSVIYTNVVLNGEGTIWIAGYYWADQLGITMTTSSGVVTEVRSIDDFKALGTVHQVLYDGAGRVAGVQITLNVDFAAPQGFVIHRQDAEVPTAKAGEKVSIWMPEALRTSG